MSTVVSKSMYVDSPWAMRSCVGQWTAQNLASDTLQLPRRLYLGFTLVYEPSNRQCV